MVVSPRVSSRIARRRVAGDEALCEVHSRLQPGVRVGVVEEHRREAPHFLGTLPAGELVVVELGQLVGEARLLGVLVDLRLPAIRDRRGQPRARDHRGRAVQAMGDLLCERVLRRVGPPLGDQLLGVGGGHVDLRSEPRPGTAQRRHLQRRDGHVGDGGTGLKAAGQRDHRHAVGARHLGKAPAGGHHRAPRTEGARRLVAGERLLGVAGVARQQHHRVRRGPRRQPVRPGHEDRARGVIAQRGPRQGATDGRAPHPGDDQPGGGVPVLHDRRLRPPQRVAQVLGQRRARRRAGRRRRSARCDARESTSVDVAVTPPLLICCSPPVGRGTREPECGGVVGPYGVARLKART